MSVHKLTFLSLLLLISTQLIAQPKRPQEPKQPFKYKSEDVTFENKIDSVKLAGTLTFPKKGKHFPAVVLISGSGAQDRNSEIFNHKSFLVIADYLSTKGIAVLRVDDRGVNESEGVHNETGLYGLKRDTEAAVNYLKSRKEVDVNHIGLIGHSLGGVIAPMIAIDSKDIDFIVMLAGTGIRGDKLMLLQKELIERKMGIPEASIALGQKNVGGAYDIILNSKPNSDSLAIKLEIQFSSVFGAALPESQIKLMSKSLSIPWLVDFVKHDPKPVLQKVTCPVLALNGSNDLQVPAKENLEAIEAALLSGGNTNYTTIQFNKLNHLFQESGSGLPVEYATIEQTFSPKVLKEMTKWILTTVK